MRPRIFIAGVGVADPDFFSIDLGARFPRSVARSDAAPTDLALSAVLNALKRSGSNSSAIQYLISSTQTPDFNNPGLVSVLLAKLGGLSIPGMEIRHLSCGALYALDIAVQLLSTGERSRIVISCCDVLSRYFFGIQTALCLSPEQIAARDVFADGAAAIFLSSYPSEDSNMTGEFELLASSVSGCGAVSQSLWCELPSASRFPTRLRVEDVETGRHLPRLDVNKFLSSLDTRMTTAFESFLRSAKIERADIDMVVTHSVCEGMRERLVDTLALSELAVNDVFPQRGFIGAAGIFAGLNECKVVSGALVLLAGFMSGPAWGFGLLRKT